MNTRSRLLELKDGALVAHGTICPHWLGPLEDALPQNGRLRCPWHDYLFDVPDRHERRRTRLSIGADAKGDGRLIRNGSSVTSQGEEVGFAVDSPLEGAGFEPSVPRQESRRFEPASVPNRGGRCRRGGFGPGGDRRPDRAVEIADCRWCASEPPLESRIKPSRRVGPSRGADSSNPSPSSGESGTNLTSTPWRAGQRRPTAVTDQ